ncbi:MAG: hypothetical protein H6Q31_231 [Bacteroidetes bacterium]|nr:hypothetical protein [Bacteroidota bacterium]
MRRRVLRTCSIWLLLLIPWMAQAQWQWIGPSGGMLAGFAQSPSSPNILYAASQVYPAGVYKTTNRGDLWTRVGSISTYPYAIAVHPTTPSTVYIAAGYQVCKSTDGGVNWTSVNLETSHYARSISLQPGNPSILHCSAYYYNTTTQVPNLAYLKSTNAGLTWSAKIVSSDYGFGYAAVGDPTNANIVYVCGYCESGGMYLGKVYKSTNGGTDFIDQTGTITGYVYDLAHDPAVAGKIYAASSAGVYRSTDGGSTWTQSTGVYSVEHIAICPGNTSMLYSGTSSGQVYKSTDGGSNWSVAPTGLTGLSSMGLAVETASTVFHATVAGVFRTTNGGTLWTPVNTGISAAHITCVRHAPSNPSVVYAGVSGDAVYKTTTAGQATVTWSRIPDFYSCTEVSDIIISPTSPDILYALEGGT